MLNLNLLPPAEKLAVAYELRTRAVLAVGAAVAAVFVVALVLLLPTFFFLSFQKADVLRLLELDMEVRARAGITAQILRIQQANRMAQTVVQHEANRPKFSPLFASVLRAVPSGVRVDALEYRAKARGLDIVGFAPSREHLLSFLRNLEANPRLGRVSSPVANLVRGTDISFSIAAELK